jgi:hypothetical protein
LIQIIEHDFLDGVQLAEFTKLIFENSSNILQMFETLQLAHTLINCDEAGSWL